MTLLRLKLNGHNSALYCRTFLRSKPISKTLNTLYLGLARLLCLAFLSYSDACCWFPECHLFQEEVSGPLETGRVSVLKKILKDWEHSFSTKYGRIVTAADIRENREMLNFYREYNELKTRKNYSKTLSQSATDEIPESFSSSVSGAQPAPSTSMPLQQMTAEVSLLRARMLKKVQEEPTNDRGARSNEVMSIVQKIQQKQPRKHRGSAFIRSVLQRRSVEDIPSVSNIPRLISLLPVMHPETQAAFERFGLFPFVGGQKVPWDSKFFFHEQINIDEQGDDKT